MPFVAPWFEVSFGRRFTGLLTVGYRLYKNDGTDSVARTTLNVVEVGGGGYGVPNVTVPDDAAGIEWDTGGAVVWYAHEDIDPFRSREEMPDDIDTELTLNHGAGSWQTATIAASAIAYEVWSEDLPGAYGAGQAGNIVGNNLDTNVGSRAAPGDQMDLVNDAVDANSLANSAVQEIDSELTLNHGAGSWQTATVAASAIAQEVWSEALPGAYGAGQAGFIVGNTLVNDLQDARYMDGIYISATHGSAGTTNDIGTRANPSSNIANATTIATARGLRKFIFLDDSIYTLNQAYTDWRFETESGTYVNLNGQVLTGSMFFRAFILFGQGSPAACFECSLFSADISGAFFRCLITSNMATIATTTFVQCYFQSSDIDASGGTFEVLTGSGRLEITDVAGGTFRVDDFNGELTLENTCVGGTIYISGVTDLVDNSAGMTVNERDALVNTDTIETYLAGIHGAGSWEGTTPAAIDNLLTLNHGAGSWQTATVAASAVAYEVWSELLPGAFGAGEAGNIVGNNLDTNVGSRAAPGDEMDLIDDAITSAKYDEASAYPLKSDDSGATQVARTGADGDTLETLSDQIDGVAVPGDEMNLADDAITSAKYDETTAYPVKSDDSGATEIARTGADGDTLETLSDQIDGTAVPGDAMDLVADALDASAVATSGAQEIGNETDTILTAAHGAGAWTSASAVDWTTAEKEQIRDALGVDGTKNTAVGGQVQDIEAKIDIIDTNVDTVVADVATIKIDVAFLKQYESGDWEIKNNQMIFYDTDGTTPLKTYNLFNKLSVPADVDTYKREEV